MRRRSWSTLEEEKEEEPLLNLTPLLDVVFVMLIIFLLLAPLLSMDSIDLATGSPTSTKSAKESSLCLALHKDQSISLQGKKIALHDLAALLKVEKSRYPQAVPQVMIDKNSPFGLYQDVKNVLECCGFEQMDVLLQP